MTPDDTQDANEAAAEKYRLHQAIELILAAGYVPVIENGKTVYVKPDATSPRSTGSAPTS